MGKPKALYRTALVLFLEEVNPNMFWLTLLRLFFQACSACYRIYNGDTKLKKKERDVAALSGFEEFYDFFTRYCTAKQTFSTYKTGSAFSDKKLRSALPPVQTILLFECFLCCMGADYADCRQMILFYRIFCCRDLSNHCHMKWKQLHKGLRMKIRSVYSGHQSLSPLVTYPWRKRKSHQQHIDLPAAICTDSSEATAAFPPKAKPSEYCLADLSTTASESKDQPGGIFVESATRSELIMSSVDLETIFDPWDVLAEPLISPMGSDGAQGMVYFTDRLNVSLDLEELDRLNLMDFPAKWSKESTTEEGAHPE